MIQIRLFGSKTVLNTDISAEVREDAAYELARGWKDDPEVQAFLGSLPQRDE